MAMTATLSVVGPVIANQPVTCVLAVSNSGVDAVKVTYIQPKVMPLGAPVTVAPPSVMPQQAVATTNGTQMQVSVPGSGTVYFPFSLVVMSGAVQTGTAAQGAMDFFIGAECLASDGSSFAAQPQSLAVAQPQFGRPPGSPPNVSASRGLLQFNQATNTVLAL